MHGPNVNRTGSATTARTSGGSSVGEGDVVVWASPVTLYRPGAAGGQPPGRRSRSREPVT